MRAERHHQVPRTRSESNVGKRFNPDTGTGTSDLEGRKQSHNPMTGIRIGEASHPGPIDLPSFAARQVGRCRRSSCQRVLTTHDSTLQCPVCDAYPLCSECHIRAQRIGRCECPMSGRPVPIECRMDGYFSPAGQHIAHPSETIPVVPCPIPGCDQRLNGFGKRLDHACRHCWTLPVCDKCHKDPPPKWCRCDLQQYFLKRNRMQDRADTDQRFPGWGTYNMVPTSYTATTLRLQNASERRMREADLRGNGISGGAAGSSGDNCPPGPPGGNDPRRFFLPPRLDLMQRPMGVWQYVKKVREGRRPRVRPLLGRTALRWERSKWIKDRLAMWHSCSTLEESVRR